MAETVYIETTIPSLYVARPSGQLVEAARQRLTRIWWDEHRSDYELVCSQTVLDECERGETQMAARRVALLDSVPLLDLSPEVLAISRQLVDRGIIPMKAADDAVHIAVASVHEIDYLLTWNCKHIANPHTRERMRMKINDSGYRMPVMCSPEEFLNDDEGI